MIGEKVILRVRMNIQNSIIYKGKVAEATLLKFIGDVNTEITSRHDGDEGLFVAYDSVEFMSSIYIGDYIEFHGWIDKLGNSSRRLVIEVYKIIGENRLLKKPLKVASASGTIVVPKDRQRG